MRATMAVGVWLWLIGAGLVPAAGAAGQEAAEGGSAAQQPQARLRVELVLTRDRGEERVARLPYSLWLTDGGRQSQLSAGVEVPVRVNSEGKVQYKAVGTSIDCSAVAGEGDAFVVWLSAEHALVVPATDAEAPFEGAPMFATFRVASWLKLSDGESVELVSSTDPVTGEVMRIQVTLHVN